MPNLDQLPSYQRKSDSNNNCSKTNVIKKHLMMISRRYSEVPVVNVDHYKPLI